MIAIPADPHNGLAIAAGGMAFIVGFVVVALWFGLGERIQVWRGVRQVRRGRRRS